MVNMGSVSSERGKANARRKGFEKLKDERNIEEIFHLTSKCLIIFL